MIEYVILAVSPGIFWLWFFWRKDTYEREPASYIAKTFFIGMLSVIPAFLLEVVFVSGEGFTDMMTVGVIEELCKFMSVYLYIYRRAEFDEVMDGIVYSAASALGFATLENVLYTFTFGPGVMVVRAFLSTLGHVFFAAFWGYALGVKKITGKGTILGGLILAMVAHGIYDIILTADWYVNLLVIPLMIILYKAMSGRMRKSMSPL